MNHTLPTFFFLVTRVGVESGIPEGTTHTLRMLKTASVQLYEGKEKRTKTNRNCTTQTKKLCWSLKEVQSVVDQLWLLVSDDVNSHGLG